MLAICLKYIEMWQVGQSHHSVLNALRVTSEIINLTRSCLLKQLNPIGMQLKKLKLLTELLWSLEKGLQIIQTRYAGELSGMLGKYLVCWGMSGLLGNTRFVRKTQVSYVRRFIIVAAWIWKYHIAFLKISMNTM